jgi:hypothetical protein
MTHSTAANNNPIPTTAAFTLILLTLFAAGCGEPKDAVWLNPEKTLEQAEEDMSNCYFDAFLDRRKNPVPEKFSNVPKDPKAGIELAARECMKQAGYKRIASAKVKPPIRIKSGTAHTMPYSIAGK